MAFIRSLVERPFHCCFKLSSHFNVNARIVAKSSVRACSTISSYDVVITGGGLVGTSMAVSLGKDEMFKDKKVLLLEASPKPSTHKVPDIYSSRTCAISPATVELLKGFGAWENVCNMRYQEVKRMQVWDSCSDSEIDFNHSDLTNNLAYIVENNVLLSAISMQLGSVEDVVNVLYGAKAEKYELESVDSSCAKIKLSQGDTIHAKLVIGADGFKSQLRETANIHCVRWEYDQMGVVATLNLAEEYENNTAWQRFLPTGPIAMLPLDSTHSCLIWTTTTDDAKNLMKLPEESFVDAINNAFWSEYAKNPVAEYATRLFGTALQTAGLDSSPCHQLPPTVMGVEKSTVGAFPLGLCHASHYTKHRMALIGDAAHRVHPLAGQGVNLGFGDVACLRDQLSAAIYNGSDIGIGNHLLSYEKERQRHVVPIMATIDSLNRLYGTSWTPVVLLRSLGLQATNSLGPLKQKMMQFAQN